MSDNSNLSNTNHSLDNENETLNADLNNMKLNKSDRGSSRGNNSEYYRKNNQRGFCNPHANNLNTLRVSDTEDRNHLRTMEDRCSNDHSFVNPSHYQTRNKHNTVKQPLDDRRTYGRPNYNAYNRKDQSVYDDNKFSEQHNYGNEGNKSVKNTERRFDNREHSFINQKYQERSQQHYYGANKQANSTKNYFNNDYDSYRNTKNVSNYRGKSSNRGNNYYNNNRTTNRSGYGTNDHSMEQGENREISFQQYNNKEVYKHENKSKYNNNVKSNKDNLNIRNEKIETIELNQRDSLIKQLSSNKYECMICVAFVRPEAATWCCDNCYHIFHLTCIKKWADTCENAGGTDGTEKNLRCPTCQKEYALVNGTADKELFDYRCFCNKMRNPVMKRGIVPHSCDEVCEKPLKTANGESCVHLCSLLCHPGPCPSCEAIVTRSCHCGVTKMTTKCTSDTRTLVCGSQCDKVLNCGFHQCLELCHADECNPCEAIVEQRCCCERGVINASVCGSAESLTQFCCGARCERVLNCGNHKCDQECHPGPCDPCPWSADILVDCWCGKHRLAELLVNGQSRQSCLDQVPSCGEVCGKSMAACGHVCTRQCHEGSCEPCPLTRNVNCRCGKSTELGVPCDSGTAESASWNQPFKCSKVCNKKLQCGRHRCTERCCDAEFHLCLQQCGRVLRCKTHSCERECGHQGSCPPCFNASFDELHCACGSSVMLPPIPCGQKPPSCDKLCSRTHSCDHAIRHNCHSEESCPPCTELVSKSCPGEHRVMDNVPCFRPVVTCGLECGRSLPGCEHSCIRICHQGNCVTDGIPCKQPCQRPRTPCGHPCAEPCHDNDMDCQVFGTTCSVMTDVFCSCGLRTSQFQCAVLVSVLSDTTLMSSYDLSVGEEGSTSVPLNCDVNCESAAFMASRRQAACLPASYDIIQLYYARYFEDFCRGNFNFVISVEKIFSNMHQLACTAPGSDSVHKFQNISVDKARFIVRFTTRYQMVAMVSYQFESNIAHVSVTSFAHKTVSPKSILSKCVEEKYFKIFKPTF